MDPRFSYETYQDVRDNVFKYSVVLLNVAGWAILTWIVPPAAQAGLGSLIGQLLPEPWKALVNTVGVLGVFTLLAFALVEIFKVHDRVYDKSSYQNTLSAILQQIRTQPSVRKAS
jgi:hypothetical protein